MEMSGIKVKITVEFIDDIFCDEADLMFEGKTLDEMVREIIADEGGICAIGLDDRGKVVKVERIEE